MAHAEQLLAGRPKPEAAERDAKAGHGAKGAAGASKGKGKKGPSLGARLKQGGRWTGLQLVELARSLRSPDGPTRRMSLFFFVSLLSVGFVGVLTVQRKVALKHEQEAHVRAAQEEAAERSQEAELLGNPEAGMDPRKLSMLSLGAFTIELKPVEGRPKAKGVMDVAEVELVIECDSKATHDYIEENLVQARSQMTDIFLSTDREELLSREGKRKLKKRLLERLNGWIPHGKVQNVFFSKLVVA